MVVLGKLYASSRRLGLLRSPVSKRDDGLISKPGTFVRQPYSCSSGYIAVYIADRLVDVEKMVGMVTTTLLDHDNVEHTYVGSCFLTHPDGYFLTAGHVLQPKQVEVKRNVGVSFPIDKNRYGGLPVHLDVNLDFALVRLTGSIALSRRLCRRQFPCTPLADSQHVRVGEPVWVKGYPDGMPHLCQVTSAGGVSSIFDDFENKASYLRTDAHSSRGFSGGPLYVYNICDDIVEAISMTTCGVAQPLISLVSNRQIAYILEMIEAPDQEASTHHLSLRTILIELSRLGNGLGALSSQFSSWLNGEHTNSLPTDF